MKKTYHYPFEEMQVMNDFALIVKENSNGSYVQLIINELFIRCFAATIVS
jgi:hypothetical protein